MAGGCALGLCGMNGGVSGTEEQVEGLFDGVGVESVHAALGTLCVRMCLCVCMRVRAPNLGRGL